MVYLMNKNGFCKIFKSINSYLILAKYLNFISSYDNVIWVHKSQNVPTNAGFQSNGTTWNLYELLYTMREG